METRSLLMAASAGIILLLGAIHLLYTFAGIRLHPRDPELRRQMQRVPPVLSAQTSMWRAWVGFNASHSMGALLFGLVYGFLAIGYGDLLFSSPFLLGLGLSMLLGYTVLGAVYWFSIPLAGISMALLLYLASVVVALG